MPSTSYDNSGVEEVVVGFVAALRGAGLVVPVSSTLVFIQALSELGIETTQAMYWAGRSTLVTRPEDQPIYDEVFKSYWSHGAVAELRTVLEPQPITLVLDDGDEPPAGPRDPNDVDAGPVVAVRYSAHEVISQQDFAHCTDDELAEAYRLMDQMRITAALRSARRPRSAGSRGPTLELGKTLRQSLRSGGETIQLATSKPGRRPRRLVLLVDISGSMEPYARSLVRFVHAAVVGRTRVEAFTLGTQLTRITRELTSRDPDAALDRAANAAQDWSGGTRLGEMLEQFNNVWGVRGMARGSVVVILSDGWDRGDPDQLAEQMGRLSRVAHRIIWVNPLKASPGYEPLARGMAAALPFVDKFVEGHSLGALESLAKEIAA